MLKVVIMEPMPRTLQRETPLQPNTTIERVIWILKIKTETTPVILSARALTSMFLNNHLLYHLFSKTNNSPSTLMIVSLVNRLILLQRSSASNFL